MSQGGLSSPIAWVYKWWGRPPTESEERLESRYRRTPDQEPLQAGGVRGEVDRTSAEDSEASSQQVEGPNGLPRGGATSWVPQDAVTSTPAGREALNYTTFQDLLTPVTGQVGAHGNGAPKPPAGLVQTPGSLREEEEERIGLRDPAVNGRERDSPFTEDLQTYWKKRSLKRTSAEPEFRRETRFSGGEQAHGNGNR
eukprot:GHVR01091282.1.p1 GENE.GHVR01091282.1~~GHVR01091282.1.p1  ORF type:complete len:197 (+),score=33.97 GHVR01091282.1:430-1020(+)